MARVARSGARLRGEDEGTIQNTQQYRVIR
jgi:hypothetical protein